MKTTNRSSMAAVAAAALLLGTLAGVAWARPRSDGPQPAETTRQVTLAAADFIPARDGDDWYNSSGYVVCYSSGSGCLFTAPVVFPCLPSVTIERIRLHVNDSNGSGTAIVTLHRAKPSKGVINDLESVTSPTGTSGGFQTYTSDPINKVVWPSQRAYVYLGMYTNIYVYGVTIEYRRNV